MASSRRQQRDPRLLVEREIIGARRHLLQEFGHRALMHVGILPQVEAGQVEAETVRSAAQVAQAATGQNARAVLDQRVVDKVQVGLEGRRRGIGRDLGGRSAPLQRSRRGAQARGDVGEGEAIRLLPADQAAIGRGIHQGDETGGNFHQPPGQGEFPGKGLHLLFIEAQHPVPLEGDGLPQDGSGDKGIAVPVAANPAADAQEGRHLRLRRLGIELGQLILDGTEQAGYLLQEGIIIVGEAVHHLVRDRQLDPAQQRRSARA